ncbi:MAG: GNAT family N-acetyltransferase [Candidatus Acidiferrales bacterium]
MLRGRLQGYDTQMKPWFPIETERLLLREFRPGDEGDIQAYAGDSEVVKFMEWGPNDPATTKAVLANWLKDQERWPRDSVTLGIELKSEIRLIGAIRLTVKDKLNETADLGYSLNRRYWQKGFATEAARPVLDAAFRHLGLHRVWATCDPANHASYRIMEKLGMRREGNFKQDVKQRGEWRDSYFYAVLKEEWLSK